MLQPYTTDDLIEAVRRDCFLATSDENWTDERILSIAHDVILEGLAPRMKNAHQNWFQQAASVTLVESITAYDVPAESMWNGVSSVQLRQLSDGLLCGKLTVIDPENEYMYGQPQNPAIPSVFWVNQTELNVIPAPDSVCVDTYDLKLTYYRRPAQMITLAKAVTVQSVTSLSVTTSAQPSYFSTNAPDAYTSGTPSRVDVYNRLQPYTRRFTNLTGSITSSTGFTFNGSVTSTQVAQIQSGDILTVYGTTIFPDVPPELHPYLRRLTSATIRLAQGDPAYQAVIATANADVENFLRGMSNRTDGTARKLSIAMSAAGRVLGKNRGYRRGSD
jgi:hypothetical protein